MDKSIIRRIIIALLSVLLLVYVIYLLSNASFKNIRTESATYSTMTESLDVDGYFIRSETIMNSKNIGGVISYKMEDTDKVSKGEKVAECIIFRLSRFLTFIIIFDGFLLSIKTYFRNILKNSIHLSAFHSLKEYQSNRTLKTLHLRIV